MCDNAENTAYKKCSLSRTFSRDGKMKAFAHLAERKGSLVLIYHRQALSYGEHSLLCTTYLPHGMQGDNGNRVVHHKAKQALLHKLRNITLGL